MRLIRLPLALLVLASAPAALAAPGPAQPGALGAVTACRAIPEAAARLACYDKAAAELAAADASGEIVVLDRQKVESVKREAFGFNLPKLDLFGGKGGDAPASLDRIEGVAKQAWQNGAGGWTIVLEDGAKWDQVGRDPVRRAPKAGSKISIRRASMGSFFLNVDGQTAIRARRID
ncbi:MULTISPECIES: hypothetical protein [unclassified Caulobacter]|uniref:hypothetical protein n=1 Tax=unclassified Caulobacter TaxID=2648921 RepID=UPI0011B47EF3|nr:MULTISPECIES: hypothetical protein [unclassified Caulobacter]